MAFSTGTAASLSALMTALDTFAVANGWTQDLLDTANGKTAMHRNSIYVSFRWNTGTPLHLGVYQALGYTGGNDPGTHPGDSGNGAVSATNTVLDDERCVENIGNGPFTYWFFEQDFYLHICVEVSADVFRHFGMGTLVKTGDWTGGEYAYGQFESAGTGATASSDTRLLDGLFDIVGANAERAATLHLEGLPAQAGTSKWGNVWARIANAPNDTAGNVKVNIQGGFRGGPTADKFGRLAVGLSSGGIPMYPVELYYRDTTNSRAYYLGYQPDVRGINLKNFSPRQVVTIGSDSWYMFPSQQKITGSTGSQNQGIAYRRDNG